jgi:hypothetical protein
MGTLSYLEELQLTEIRKEEHTLLDVTETQPELIYNYSDEELRMMQEETPVAVLTLPPPLQAMRVEAHKLYIEGELLIREKKHDVERINAVENRRHWLMLYLDRFICSEISKHPHLWMAVKRDEVVALNCAGWTMKFYKKSD